MLMIVASHFAQHGGFEFSVNQVTVNRLWQQFLYLGGQRGNDIFVLISGYFLIKSRGVKINKAFNLWLRVFFYSVVVFILLNFSGYETFSLKAAIKSLMPITKGWWWFPKTYFVLYLIHPYLNFFLHNFSREDYKKFLITVFTYWCIIPTLTNSPFESSSLLNFICLYSLAGYFRLWDEDLGSKKSILYGIFFMILDLLIICLFDIMGKKSEFFAKHALYFKGMMRPFTLMSAIYLLLGFKKIDICTSKNLNIIASATFGVYLIHENQFSKHFLWYTIFKTPSFQDSPYLIPYSIAVIFIVYFACTAIELLRIKIFKALSKGKLS